MIFTYTHEWLTGVSPHTGQPKTQTRRLWKPEYFEQRTHGGGRWETHGIWKSRRGGPEHPHKDTGYTRCPIKILEEIYTPVYLVYDMPMIYRRRPLIYAIQPGRGKRGVGYFKITKVRVEPLQNITEADAQAEGCRNVAHFGELWDQIHKKPGTRFGDNPKVIVLGIEMVEAKENVQATPAS